MFHLFNQPLCNHELISKSVHWLTHHHKGPILWFLVACNFCCSRRIFAVSWRNLHFSPVSMEFQSANTTRASKASLYASSVTWVGPIIGSSSSFPSVVVPALIFNSKKIAECQLTFLTLVYPPTHLLGTNPKLKQSWQSFL